MFSRIIIATELSPFATSIISCLSELKSLGVKECLLMECLNPCEMDSKISEYYQSIIEENLKEQKEMLAVQGYTVSTRVTTGHIKNEINRIALEEDFSMIVVGATKHSMIGDAVLGGMAHEIVQYARKPILIVRVSNEPINKTKQADACNILEHTLFPTDFSENAEKAFEYVKKMVADGVKKVTLAHVIDKAIIEPYLKHRQEEFSESDYKKMEVLKEKLLTLGMVEVDIKLLYGSPSAELLKLIENEKISLIVMGSQGRGFIPEVFLGSVSHNLARHASASVLLIPTKREYDKKNKFTED